METMREIEEETQAALREKQELENLLSKAKKEKKKMAKEKEEPKGKMSDWARGVFIHREDAGQILSFSFQGHRFAIKDGEEAEMPLEIAEHLNTKFLSELEWVREGKDDHEGKRGEKKIKNMRPRFEFRILETFKRPASYKIPKPPRHRL